MSAKPLSSGILDEKTVSEDRKKCSKYDQCGLGREAVYVPSKIAPRAYYIPYKNVERIYQRVAVSRGSGRAFLTPVLYIVFQYDGGREKVCYFRYVTDSDKMFEQLRREHPEIPLVSEQSEQKEKEKEAEEERIRSAGLSREARDAVRDLENADQLLAMRPKLYKELAQSARFKRSVDLIRPLYVGIASGTAIGGLALTIIGIIMLRFGSSRNAAILLALIGIAAMFLMVNIGILPTPSRNRKAAQKRYDNAVSAMQHALKGADRFPVPSCYAHPYVLQMMERLIREGRATDTDGALTELKEDLRKMDSTVQLGGEEYERVRTVKPLFLVTDYR